MFLFHTGTVNGKYCCPQLFINHRCFSGPYLNKGRIAELPQSVGPGKCVLVLKEVKLVHSRRRWGGAGLGMVPEGVTGVGVHSCAKHPLPLHPAH